jgi:3-oxoacyl-[acyl-carrier-protein] synthase III
MHAEIKDIEYAFPANTVNNRDLKNENPDWIMERIVPKTGVYSRYIASEQETAFSISLKACDKLFEKYDKHLIDTIIYCTQSPDYIMPPNAYLLHGHYALAQNVIAFDITQACSGFIYGLLLANSMIKAGTSKNVLLVNADTYSKYINKRDRSTRMLFGDGAAATIIGEASDGGGLIDFAIASAGKEYEGFYIPGGGNKLPHSNCNLNGSFDGNGNFTNDTNIHMNGMGVLSYFKKVVPKQVKQLLEKNDVVVDDIDMFIFHQASKIILDLLSRSLKLRNEQIYNSIHSVGNLVSASIPAGLKMAIEEKKVKKGDSIVLSGFGVGFSWGTCLIKY